MAVRMASFRPGPHDQLEMTSVPFEVDQDELRWDDRTGMVRGMKSLILIGVLSLAVPSLSAQQTSASSLGASSWDVSSLGWMAGCWEQVSGGRVTTESWMPPSGGMMVGGSRTVANGQARAFEHLRIMTRQEGVVYTAVPSGQTETDFLAVLVSDSMVTFENPEHDFPQRISYRKLSADSIVARVEGPSDDGSTQGFDVPMGRVSCNPHQ